MSWKFGWKWFGNLVGNGLGIWSENQVGNGLGMRLHLSVRLELSTKTQNLTRQTVGAFISRDVDVIMWPLYLDGMHLDTFHKQLSTQFLQRPHFLLESPNVCISVKKLSRQTPTPQEISSTVWNKVMQGSWKYVHCTVEPLYYGHPWDQNNRRD